MANSLAGNPRSGGGGPTRQQLDELDALLQRMLDLPVSQGDEPDDPPEPPARPAQRTVRTIPAPEPDLPPVRYYEPDYHEDEEDHAAELPPSTQPIAPRVAYLEAPVPGGRHDLEEDTPTDPAEELARIRAAMQQQADRQVEHSAEPGALPPTANIPNAPHVGQGEWVPLRSSWQPSAQTWKPLADRWEQSRPSDPAPAPAPVSRQAQPPVYPSRPAPSGPMILTQTASEPEPIIPPPPRPVQAAAPARPAPAPVAQEPEAPATPWPLMPLVWFNAVFDVVLLPWCPKGKWLRGPAGRKLLGMLGVICLLAAAALVFADTFGWIW